MNLPTTVRIALYTQMLTGVGILRAENIRWERPARCCRGQREHRQRVRFADILFRQLKCGQCLAPGDVGLLEFSGNSIAGNADIGTPGGTKLGGPPEGLPSGSPPMETVCRSKPTCV